MAVSKLRQIGRWCARPFDRLTVLAVLSGWIGGTYLCAWSLGLSGMLGSSIAFQTALAAVVISAVLLGRRIEMGDGRPFGGPWLSFALIHFGLAALAVCFPSLIELVPYCASLGGDAWINSPGAVACFSAVVAGIFIGLPTFCIVRLSRLLAACQNSQRDEQEIGDTTRMDVRFLCGLSLGLLFDALVLAPLLDLQVTVSLAALAGGALFVCGLIWASREKSTTHSAAAVNGSHVDGPTPLLVELKADPRKTLRTGRPVGGDSPAPTIGGSERFLLMCVAIATGMLLAAGPRLFDQLVPQTTFLLIAQWSLLLFGAALGLIGSIQLARRGIGQTQAIVCTCLALAVGTCCLFTAFPWLVYRILWINSHFSQVWFLLLIRGSLPGLLMVPTGVLLGLFVGATRRQQSVSAGTHNRSPFGWARRILQSFGIVELSCALGITAYALTQGKLIATWGVAWTLWTPAALLTLGALGRVLVPLQLPQALRARAIALACVCIVAVAPCGRSNYLPALSARLLFNSNVLMAARSNIHPRTLCFLDEGRNVGVMEGAQGTYTVWRFSSSQYQIRENGIPVGLVSSDTEVHPNYSAETLQAAIPLILHQQPRRVLLLGLGSGVPLKKCLSSPIQSVTCVESDASLVQLVRTMLRNSSAAVDWNDDRLRLRTVDPALVLAASPEYFDVIISNADQASLHPNGSDYTREFYSRIARRLSSDGIFCQRFQCVDFGAGPIRSMVLTLQSVFKDVAAFEMAPGEFLFASTNDPRGLIRPGLIARLQTPHIRRFLSETGWDWSLPLTLSAYSHKGLKKVADAGPAQVNTILNAHFALRLPQEVMRWGQKAQEVRAALQPEASHLAEWIGADAEKQDVLRRLSELAGSQNLMNKFPDQYWAYRKHVREHLTSAPLASVRQVNYEDDGQPDPEDKRRLAYFTALGKAARSMQIEDIRKVAEFDVPFDPMLSFFLQAEVAELYAKAKHPDPRQELRHRLHATYFSSPADSSIHNIVDAITLQLEYPQSATVLADRWDQLNSLLQALRTRWDVPGTLKPGIPKNVLRDVDMSLVAAEKAIDYLEAHAAEVGFSTDDWPYRREVLEKSLVRPLRSYREILIPYVGRERILETRGEPDVDR